MKENPDKANELMTDNIKAYLDILRDNKDEKPILTEKGIAMLEFLREHADTKTWKARDIAEGMGISSRGASGSLRSLTTKGFCEKVAENPSVYTLTDKGKNFIIVQEEIDE